LEELDRVLDRDDVELLFAVDLVEHGRERRRLAGTGRSRDENQASRLLAKGLHDRGQAELPEPEDLVRDLAIDTRDRAPLHEVVRAEARESFDAEREIEFQGLFEAVLLAVGQDRVGELLGLRYGHRRIGQGNEPSVQPDHRRRAGRQVQVGRTHFDHLLEQLMKCRIARHLSL
jgi:hypothetical protein